MSSFLYLIFLFGAAFAYCFGVGLRTIEKDFKRGRKFERKGRKIKSIADQDESKKGSQTRVAAFRAAEPNDADSTGNAPGQEEGDSDWIGGATLGVLYLTFCAAVAAAYEGDRLATDTQEAIEHADAVAASQHADTVAALSKADKANIISNLALVSSQRAFLFVSETTVTPTVNNEGHKVLRIFPKWTNSGETPTRGAHISAFCEATIAALNYRNPRNVVPDLVGPKQVKAMGNCDFVVPDDIQLKSGVVASAVVGAKATYFDVFDNKVLHVTEFCATFPVIQDYSPDTGRLVMSAGATFIYCNQHNCVDDECPPEDR
jgi:hypothetical protein